MKRFLIILLTAIISLTCYCQSMDQISASISRSIVDSFSQTLDSVVIRDATKSATFNIDTIRLNSGEFKIYSVSFTAIQTNGTVISRGQYLSWNAISNTAGSYYLKTSNAMSFSGIVGVAINPLLINNNTMCVVKVTINNSRDTKIHYRRVEQ